jgi:hypothetical protein
VHGDLSLLLDPHLSQLTSWLSQAAAVAELTRLGIELAVAVAVLVATGLPLELLVAERAQNLARQSQSELHTR